jgi:hypothetical protein
VELTKSGTPHHATQAATASRNGCFSRSAALEGSHWRHKAIGFNAYGQPKMAIWLRHPPQFPFRPQSIDMTSTQATTESCVDPNNLTNQLATILRESFGIEPKGRGRVYQKSYLNYYDQLFYPRGYKVSEFSKFSGEDEKIIVEHVDQFILQCSEASANGVLKLRIFPLCLSGTVFTWFTSLAPNSIFTWAQLE